MWYNTPELSAAGQTGARSASPTSCAAGGGAGYFGYLEAEYNAKKRLHWAYLNQEGEELIETLTALCEKEGVYGASFTGLGACSQAVTQIFDTAEHRYYSRLFDRPVKLTSLNGTVSRREGKAFLHVHASFSDEQGHCHGGHMKSLLVSATCEITMHVFPQPVERAYDENTNLYIWQL